MAAAAFDEFQKPATPASRVRGVGIALLLATLIAYWPAISAGFIWDDPDYVLHNANLRDTAGLFRIWTNISASPQYYPAVFTTFWFEFHVYRALGLVSHSAEIETLARTPAVPGLFLPGFHVVNILLHALGGFLLWRILDRLNVPGAMLAAFVWTLHPVQVESVAWITERKNVLSAVFYFASALFYLRWLAREEAKSNRLYAWSLALFVCALLSKSVTASLPAAILLVLWWKRGTLRWSDLKPLVPFFLIGAALGLHTGYLERTHVGATGPEFEYADTTLGELATRTLIAGRAYWFYAGKLAWPAELAFMYERWQIDLRNAAQWIFPAAAGVFVVVLMILRNKIGRGPLVCVLFFGGTLLPAVGFLNVYPHRYSFVADHFQHLASIGLIVLFCAIIVRLIRREEILVGLFSIPLILLTIGQSRDYKDPITLWERTAERSPRAWIAWSNLGKLYADIPGRLDDAIAAHERAFELAPDKPDTIYNMAMIRARFGDYAEANRLLEAVLERTTPKAALRLDAMLRLASIAELQGDLAAERKWLRAAFEAQPNYVPTRQAYVAFVQRHGFEP